MPGHDGGLRQHAKPMNSAKAIARRPATPLRRTTPRRRKPRRPRRARPHRQPQGASPLSRQAGRRRPAPPALRLRAVRAVEERPPAGRHRHPRQAQADRHRRSHPGPAVHPHRARVSGFPRQRPAAAGNFEDARQAVPQRSSRSVLQRRGRRRHRAGDVPRRRRRGRARHLPDQRDPRPFAASERHAQAAAARDPGRRDYASAGRRRRATSARGSGSPARCIRGQYDEGDLAERIDAYDKRRAAIHPYKPRDPARWGEAAFYGWSEDKARQYGVPQRADFGAFVRRKGFNLD